MPGVVELTILALLVLAGVITGIWCLVRLARRHLELRERELKLREAELHAREGRANERSA